MATRGNGRHGSTGTPNNANLPYPFQWEGKGRGGGVVEGSRRFSSGGLLRRQRQGRCEQACGARGVFLFVLITPSS